MLRFLTEESHHKTRMLFYFLAITFSFALGYFFYIWQIPVIFGTPGHAHVAVALDVLAYADSFDLNKILKMGIRTYGYLAFLWPFRFFLNWFNMPLNAIGLPILILQFAFYAFSVFFFAFSVTKNKAWQLFIVASLLLNILVIPFFSITMAEALSVSLILLCYAVYCRSNNKIIMTFLLGLLAAFAVEVRPANVWVFGLISILFLLQTLNQQHNKKNKFLFLLVYGIGAFIAFFPQLYVNYLYFQKITPLPAIGLGKLQFAWGKEMLHVSFVVHSSGVAALVSQNPFMLIKSHFSWVSLNGLGYFILKLISLFLYDDLFVYQMLSSVWERLLVLFSCFCVFFGFLGLYYQRNTIPKKHYLALLLGILFCVTLHIITAFETRFMLVVFMALFPLAIYQVWFFIKEQNWLIGIAFVGFFGFMYTMHIIFLLLAPTYLPALKLGILPH